MPSFLTNPATALREAVEPHLGSSMLRCDTSGRALLISDLPRRLPDRLPEILALPICTCTVDAGLLWIDLPEEAYAHLLHADGIKKGPWHPDWFAEQSLLSSILSRPQASICAPPDIPLLRSALLACAMGDTALRTFLTSLRPADADALRRHSPCSTRACAALCAHQLHVNKAIGVPLSTPLFIETDN